VPNNFWRHGLNLAFKRIGLATPRETPQAANQGSAIKLSVWPDEAVARADSLESDFRNKKWWGIMKKIISLCMGMVLVAFALLDGTEVQAQQPVPLEIYACNFLDGAGMSDVQVAIDEFNEWADENDIGDLNSSVVTPYFYSAALPYDLLFVNRWTNGAALGAGHTLLTSPGGQEILAGFGEAIECASHTQFVASLVSAPAAPRDGGPMQFLNCTVKDNRTAGEGIAAISEWAESSAASGAGHVVYFPLAGEDPAATYDFKWVVLHASYQAWGDSLDRMFGGGGNLGSIINPVMDCDSARIYNQVTIRSMQQ